MDTSDVLSYLYPGITFGPMGQCAIDGRTGKIIAWKRAEPQPTDAELKAAEPAAFVAIQAREAKRVESDTARSEVKQAYSELQPLIEHKDPAIALLAAILQKHLLATLGR